MHTAGARTPTRPESLLTSEWQAILAAGAAPSWPPAYGPSGRTRARNEQRDFVEGSGVSQQTLSEWERGVRGHFTTETLYLVSHLTACTSASCS